VIININPTADHNDNLDPFTYTSTSRYTFDKFYRVIIDTRALKRSTVNYRQYFAYRKTYNTIINILKAGAINIQFGIGSTPSIGFIIVNTPVGNIEFYIVKADIPFLLCLTDIDTLKVYYNNLKNILVTPTKLVSMVCQFSHPFLLWEESLQSFITHLFDQNPCYLTITKLYRLHRRFRHPLADKLYRVLKRSSHDNIDKQVINYLTRYCSYCQKHGKSPR